MTLAAAHKTLKMPVSKPCFGVGFKEKPLPPNDLRTEALYDPILEAASQAACRRCTAACTTGAL